MMVTSIKPDVKPLGRYTATDTAMLLGIHRNTLRLFVMRGEIKPLPVNPNTRSSRFLGSEISKCWESKTIKKK